MNRRKTLKTLLVGTAGAAAVTQVGCKVENIKDGGVNLDTATSYGRTQAEKEWDDKVNSEDFLNEHELSTIATLCDIILPKTPTAASATEAAVPEFIEFIVKDLPRHQLPLRGGLMWLDIESQKRFNNQFNLLSEKDQISIIDDIAYPDPDNEKPDMAAGIKFFNRMRNLTLTGYYTTKMGFDDLGYKGNIPNTWDGVPDDVLKDHDVAYDPEWIAKCINHDKREEIAAWDDNGNLLNN